MIAILIIGISLVFIGWMGWPIHYWISEYKRKNPLINYDDVPRWEDGMETWQSKKSVINQINVSATVYFIRRGDIDGHIKYRRIKWGITRKKIDRSRVNFISESDLNMYYFKLY